MEGGVDDEYRELIRAKSEVSMSKKATPEVIHSPETRDLNKT